MKINFIMLCVALIIGFGWTIFTNQAPPDNSPKKSAPPFETTTLTGNQISLADFQGKKIYLHFWASWCAPCLVEFPEIVTFANKNDEIVVLTIAVQDTNENIEKFLRKIKKELPENFFIALDPEWKIAKDTYNVRKLPETFSISTDLTIEKRFVGAQSNWDKMNLSQ